MTDQAEFRFSAKREVLTYLCLANGHRASSNADIGRASLFTCCYLWQLAHPDFKSASGFQEECQTQARWLLEPGAFTLLTAGARHSAPIDLESTRLREFERAFLKTLNHRDRQEIKLQAPVPRGLWMAVREAYGIRHGSTGPGFVRLMAALLQQAQALELEPEPSDV